MVPSPFDVRVNSSMSGVDAVSSDDVWAVGASDGGDDSIPRTMHWDGTKWTGVDIAPLTGWNGLLSVVAISTDDVWAVGHHTVFGTEALVEHWDGAAWTSDTPREGWLSGVDAASTDDVWAVGLQTVDDQNQTLTMHWDGTMWETVPSPSFGAGANQLSDVAVVSSDDVWAVGSTLNLDGSIAAPLTMHWDGASWSLVPTPGGGPYSVLTSVSGISTNDVWAVGFSQRKGAFSLHWDGTAWRYVPAKGDELYSPEAVVAIASDDVWMVGWYWNEFHSSDTGFAQHWDGTTWRLQNLPHDGEHGISHNYVYDLTAVSSTDLWTVGGTYGPDRNLTERYAAIC